MSVSLSSSVAYFVSAHPHPLFLPPSPVSVRVSLLHSGVRPAYANNRVPVLQRCGGQKEPLSPGHGARGASEGGLKDGARKAIRESEGGHCVPPTLTPVKGYPEEKVGSGFGPTRKRQLCLKAEPEDTEEGERLSYPEKRAKILGENFLNMLRHPHIYTPTSLQFCPFFSLHPVLC